MSKIKLSLLFRLGPILADHMDPDQMAFNVYGVYPVAMS